MSTAPSPAATRSTRQKRHVSAVLERSPGFRSAQDIYAELRSRGERVGLTTVYAQLHALEAAGEVDVTRSEGGEALYRRCRSEDHHHHLVCRRCGHAEEVEGPEVEAWAARIGAESGFAEVDHTVEIHGVCPSCS